MEIVTKETTIRSREGAEFDCYLAAPAGDAKVPGVVMASSVRGVDADLRAIADELAAHGFLAAAPDLFWRSLPGPVPRGDKRGAERSQPRLEKIRAGEADIADTLAAMRKHPRFNGRAASMGFCYGGPYAILGPKRLGFDAGIAFHATQMLDFVAELTDLARPVCLLWGDKDFAAPPPVLEAYRSAASRMKNLELHVFPGVLHDYMGRSNPEAFDPERYRFSMERAIGVIRTLA
jgi:carboxymethylenebutenolidase